ncbi:MAG: radical SAM protein [Promethearchaeota archaeon]
MNKSILELLKKIKSGAAIYPDFETFLAFAQELTRKNFNNILKIYIPTKRFPAISITGNDCALQCEHCNKKYLNGMEQITSKTELELFLLKLANNEGVGALISGGCDSDGAIPLDDFLDTIKKIKENTNLIINSHTGLLTEETAKKIAAANIDIVSFDVNMDKKIIKNIYHLNKDLNDYKRAIEVLKKYSLNIVPHMCIGLYYGELHKELDSIKFIKDNITNLSLIVIIALIPPKDGKEIFKTPKPIDIAKVIAIIRFLFPKTEISLGCMRPRRDSKVLIEKYAIKAGITRIEIPSRETIKWVKEFNQDINLKYFSACCAIPEKYEAFALSKNSDIKRYLNL